MTSNVHMHTPPLWSWPDSPLLPSLCSFFPTAWPSQPGTWQLHLLCSGSRAISSNFRRWLLIGCFVSCRSQVKGHLLRKASHGPHPKWILLPPHCITPLCFTLPISLHDPSAAFLASPSPLQHAAALGVTRGDHYLEVFTKQSLEERYLEWVKRQKRKAMNYILKGKIVWSTCSQTWPHIGIIWGL